MLLIDCLKAPVGDCHFYGRKKYHNLQLILYLKLTHKDFILMYFNLDVLSGKHANQNPYLSIHLQSN